jgi:hypothetical protein
LSVGLGAVLLAPKRRFMAQCVTAVEWSGEE